MSATLWTVHRAIVVDTRPDWGYAGIMVILAFTYVLSRVQFVYASVVGALAMRDATTSWSSGSRATR